MITCNQEFVFIPNLISSLWEVNIYCPKLQIVVIHGRYFFILHFSLVSPIYATEFGVEIVARLAGFDGSIYNFFEDKPIGRVRVLV